MEEELNEQPLPSIDRRTFQEEFDDELLEFTANELSTAYILKNSTGETLSESRGVFQRGTTEVQTEQDAVFPIYVLSVRRQDIEEFGVINSLVFEIGGTEYTGSTYDIDFSGTMRINLTLRAIPPDPEFIPPVEPENPPDDV